MEKDSPGRTQGIIISEMKTEFRRLARSEGMGFSIKTMGPHITKGASGVIWNHRTVNRKGVVARLDIHVRSSLQYTRQIYTLSARL